MLAALPVAVYTTDQAGNITFFNEAAAALWGHRPELGTSQWCGSWRLFWPDGRPLAHEDCPMAVTLRSGKAVRGVEAIAERPDGTRVPFMPFPTLLRDEAGRVTGAINLLVDISERRALDLEIERLAAIVSSSDDAIVSKTLDGRITSWNAGATRIFGYEADEMIGQPILKIIPPDLWHEEEAILAKLRQGERIDHFDTFRISKDGRRIDISLTVSPLRDRVGTIVGASKVARDITERRRGEEMQRLLFEELNHRVKNTLAIIQAIATQSLRWSPDPANFVKSFRGRIQALASAHDLLMQEKMKAAEVSQLVRDQVLIGSPDDSRISVEGPRVMLEARAAIELALVLHELATNARKYGALSAAGGRLSIGWTVQAGENRQLNLEWKESGLKEVAAPTSQGFGSTLIERSLQSTGGAATVEYGPNGLCCSIQLPLPQIDDPVASENKRESAEFAGGPRREISGGKKILVIEDETLVAMEIESQLVEAGHEVVGPAMTNADARRLIAEAAFDVALVDGNLDGHPAYEIAADLAGRKIPFAFATGYGREGLPSAFQNVPVLSKPFSGDRLLHVVRILLAEADDPGHVVSLRKRPS
jgi:PAS domain S-box-containing protein